MNLLFLSGSLEMGLIYALVTLGVHLSFRMIDFPDLTVDGSFTSGAAVASVLITCGYSPLFATLCALLCGMTAGMITGYLNVKWHILGLLAGILTMTALYSINLRIMQSPNVALLDHATIFSHNAILTTVSTVVIVFIILSWLFATHFGLSIRASGMNATVSRAYGINVGKMKIFVLSLSNGLVALSGSLFAQSQGFADISMGQGTIIIGLASVIIGETIFSPKKVPIALLACIAGSIIYQVAIGSALNIHDIGLRSSDLNLITALIVAITMILPKLKLKRVIS